MNRTPKLSTVMIICLVVVITYLPWPTNGSGTMPSILKIVDETDLNPAINEPDEFAWTLFVELNKPATAGSKDRIWERWASDDDVYGNPNRTPIWPGSGAGLQESQPRPKALRPITQLEIAVEESQRQRPRRRRQRGLLFPPEGVGQEVRMNRASFDFIVQNNLWYIEGQEAAFAQKMRISFPIDAKEIKAVWRPITEAEKPRFHWQINPADGKPHGLIALHIITKDLPNWTWATFEQVDNPERCKAVKCRDSFGVNADDSLSAPLLQMMRDAGLGSEWEYYRLVGTQVDFTDSTGRITTLGNSIIEDGFVTSSSCITCHARATIGQRVSGRANRLSVFNSANPSLSDNGTPDPRWFFTDPSKPETMKYLQLDFVWSVLRARRRS